MINKKILKLIPDLKKDYKINLGLQLLALILNLGIYICLVDNIIYSFNGIIILLIFLRLLLNIIIVQSRQRISSKAKYQLKRASFKLMESEFLSESEKVQLSTEGIEQLDQYYSRYIPQFLYSMISPVILFIAVAYHSLSVAIVLLICVPLIPISIVFVQKFAKKLLHKYWGIYTNMGDHFLEGVKGINTLIHFGIDDEYQVKMDQEAENFRNVTMRVLMMQLNSISVMDMVAYGGSALAIFISVLYYRSGQLNLISFLFICLVAAEFFIPMRLLGSFFHIAMNGVAAGEKIYDAVEHEQQSYEILTELQDYSFSYGDKIILKSIDLKLEKGKFLILVGESGSGKSTLLKVIKRHFNSVTIQEHDSHLFKGSILDNLKMADSNLDSKEAEALMIKLNLQMGLSHYVDANTHNLSGGQRQRIALARTLLKDSEIYLFDEVTASVDPESEKVMVSLIKELKKNDKSVVMVTHRMRNAQFADEILFMKEGKIAARGSHSDLMSNEDYSKLYFSQAQYEREAL